ncbi:MAG TPA: ferredoxin family protein [Candidatus Eisenbacteria bacterium]|jgi:ferredoxin|nr:ferredoxin family protein [Candidatus Eisenbacteria bacterium]
MPHVITEKCLGEQYASCAEVCPVDCIHPGDYQGKPFMIIDPLVCIDCGLCVPECPIDAIVTKIEIDPAATKLNADLAPQFGGNPKVTPRASNDPPRNPNNKLR